MLIKLLTKVFGSRNDRTLRRMRKAVSLINAMEPEMEKLSDDELKAKTNEFRARIEKGESVESLIPEAFAVVREASKRVFGMRHFDVQLLGGMVLNDRCIAEMRTGEGKTLTATLPAYLNALSGKGVHVVTVNDYLAQRDAENNRPLFEFLGMSVGINLPVCLRQPNVKLTLPTSLTALTTNTVLTTCAITWRSARKSACSVNCIMRWWMRSTPS